MKKTQIFENKRIHTPGMKYLDEYLTRLASIFAGPHTTIFEANLFDESHWLFDTFEQFIAQHPSSIEATYLRASQDHEVEVTNIIDPPHSGTMIAVRAPNRETILKIFSIIQECLCMYPVKRPPQSAEHNPPPPTPTNKPTKATSPKTSRRNRKPPCRTTLRPSRPSR